jgi:hypothetical protein
MIIAKTDSGTLIFGLSRRNVELLVAGHPIMKESIPEAGIPRFAIVYGETEQEIYETMLKDGFDMPTDIVINLPTVNKVPT